MIFRALIGALRQEQMKREVLRQMEMTRKAAAAKAKEELKRGR